MFTWCHNNSFIERTHGIMNDGCIGMGSSSVYLGS